ncbi:MAG: PPC domain-containing protein [Thiohalomonadales bacterium]
MQKNTDQFGTRKVSKYRFINYNILIFSIILFFISQSAAAVVVANNSNTVNIFGDVNSTQLFSVDVPAGASNLNISLSGNVGDADLYVKFADIATVNNFDFNSISGSSNETVTIATPFAGSYNITIHAYTAFSGVTLSVSYTDTVSTTPPPGNSVITGNPGTVADLSSGAGSELNFSTDIPAGATNLSITLSGNIGDADLFVKFASIASATNFDFNSRLGSSNETVAIAAPSAGTYHIMVQGYSAYSGVVLTVAYTDANSTTPQPGNTVIIDNPGTITNLSNAAGSETNFSTDIPVGATNLTISLSGNTGDADLYVKFASIANVANFDFNSLTASSNETVAIAAPLAGTYHIMVLGYSAYAGVTLTVSYTAPGNTGGGVILPPDPNGFLQFLNTSAPRNNELTGNRLTASINSGATQLQETTDAGLAYYNAIDPRNLRGTLAAFKSFNNNLSDIPNAVYVNDADLGFGRRMYLTVNPKGSVSSCVENFAPVVGGVNGSLAEKLALASQGDPLKVIATVCMEYSGTPGTGATADDLIGRKYVKFFSYKAGGIRITEAELDDRGNRTQPGLCNSCHGGQGNSLLPGGVYPDNGDTGAQFLPWDLDTFKYDADPALDATARSALEPILKRFNQGVLATYQQPHTYSYTGNPVNIPDNTNDSTGVFVDIPITVANMNDPITSITISIDELAATPGITFTGVPVMTMELITPANNVIRLRTASNASAGIKNLYLVDDAGAFSQTESLVNGVLSGVRRGVTNGPAARTRFVIEDRCASGIIPEKALDLGCSSANGTWKLRINNFQFTTVLPRVTGQVNAWSLHFNAIPEAAYTPAPVELIRGWYGGRQLPSPTFNGQFIPVGWTAANNPGAIANPETLYLDVIGPTCRACHAQRGVLARNELDFSTYAKFMTFADKTKSLVYDKGLMPLAKRTFENHFWNGAKPTILAQHLNIAADLQPGRNIANAGLSRTGALAVRTGSSVKLNGNGSLFTNGNFAWTVTSPSLIVSQLTGITPTFVADEIGNYQITLDTSGNTAGTVETTSSITIESSLTAPAAISFRNDLSISNPQATTTAQNSFATCNLCHSLSPGELTPTSRQRFVIARESASSAELDEYYRVVRDRTDLRLPLESLLARKGLVNNVPHDGNDSPGPLQNKWRFIPESGFVGAARFTLYLRWLLEGANNN